MRCNTIYLEFGSPIKEILYPGVGFFCERPCRQLYCDQREDLTSEGHSMEQQFPANDHREELVALLQLWIDSEDHDEQKETGDYLIRVLDEDRLSNRKLFPANLKGVTW